MGPFLQKCPSPFSSSGSFPSHPSRSWQKGLRKLSPLDPGATNIATTITTNIISQSCPTLRPHGRQHARLPCPSPSPGVLLYTNYNYLVMSVFLFKRRGQGSTCLHCSPFSSSVALLSSTVPAERYWADYPSRALTPSPSNLILARLSGPQTDV